MSENESAAKDIPTMCEEKGLVHESNITDMTSSGVYALGRGLVAPKDDETEPNDLTPEEACKRAGYVSKEELEKSIGETFTVSETKTDEGRPGFTIYAKRVNR